MGAESCRWPHFVPADARRERAWPRLNIAPRYCYSLPLDIFLQILWAYLRPINNTLRIRRNTLCCARPCIAWVRLFISDKCLGLVESLGEFYSEAQWQRCAMHFYRNVWTAVPTSKVKEVAAMLKAIHAQEDRAAARQKAEQVVAKLREMKLADAAEAVRTGIEETLYYYAFPRGSTGGACERTTRWSASCAKCGEERERWEPSRMASRR